MKNYIVHICPYLLFNSQFSTKRSSDFRQRIRISGRISSYPSVYPDILQYNRISGSITGYPAVYPDIRLYIRRNPFSNYIIYYLQYAVQIHPYIDLVKLR